MKKVMQFHPRTAVQQVNKITDFQQAYPIKFDMSLDAISLIDMVQNYRNGIIPSTDISKAVTTIIGDAPVAPMSVDPRPAEFGGPGNVNVPKFAWVHLDDVGINPKFNRDISPRHVKKIEKLWQSDIIIVPCAVKDPDTGKFLLWDGNHTRETCARQGWTHIPVWYTEAKIKKGVNVDELAKAMIQKAGKSFLIINKTGKRPVTRYEEHMIGVSCFQPLAIAIQKILDAHKCKPVRESFRPREVSHISAVYNAYDYADIELGVQGLYLSRSLAFHVKTWPNEPINGVTMEAMAQFYYLTHFQTQKIPSAAFEIELGALLTKIYGTSHALQHDLLKQYESVHGKPQQVSAAVLGGIVLTYQKHSNNKHTICSNPGKNFPVK